MQTERCVAVATSRVQRAVEVRRMNVFPTGSLCRPASAVSCVPVGQVKRTYSQGTYRAGAMRQVSLVGAVDEEVGDYFPEFISMLADSPFLEVCAL